MNVRISERACLITLTNSQEVMKEFVNTAFQKWFTMLGSIVIFIASIATLAAAIFNL
jgi:Mn2+/Fe2+ NRAMP family transporter